MQKVEDLGKTLRRRNEMKRITILLIVLFLSGCAGNGSSLERFFYEMNQSYQQDQCRKDPARTCPEKESYEEYQKKHAGL
jgi:hypothetical protein